MSLLTVPGTPALQMWIIPVWPPKSGPGRLSLDKLLQRKNSEHPTLHVHFERVAGGCYVRAELSMMGTYTISTTRLWILLQSLFLIGLLQYHVSAFPGLKSSKGHEHSQDFDHLLGRDLDKHEKELYKRQLGGLLDSLNGLVGAAGGSAAVGNGAFVNGGLNNGGWTRESGLPLDVWSQWPFVPPGKGDERGPCPGLNAMANHNMIDHSGIVTVFDVVQAGNKFFGAGTDNLLLAALTAVLGGGDPLTLTFSIGGPNTRVGAPLGGLGGLLGKPMGLDYAHNLAEVDGSLTRNDLFVTGDCWTLDMGLFQQMYSYIPEGQHFDLYTMGSLAALRFHQSVATNPNMYWGPYSGPNINGAKLFATRLMANYSDRNPDGKLTHEIIKSFFAVSDRPNPFTYNFGWEKFPENWYPRTVDYDVSLLLADMVQWFVWFPELASIGGNLGQVDTFAGVTLDDPASGAANLLRGNPICFALGVLKEASPSFLNNIYATVFDMVGKLGSTLQCPEVGALTVGGVPIGQHLRDTYPGARQR